MARKPAPPKEEVVQITSAIVYQGEILKPGTLLKAPRSIVDNLRQRGRATAPSAEVDGVSDATETTVAPTAPADPPAPQEPKEPVDLDGMTRDELNAHAASLGLEGAEALPNKDAVIDLIEAAS